MKIEEKRSSAFNIIAAICIILFCVSIAPKILQNDTFYTIKIGEYIYNNGISDLTKDMYSWHELPYTYPHWLYDLGMFIIYNIGGQPAIYISTMVFSALLGLAVYALSCEKSNNKVLSLVITIGSIYLMKSFIAARAQLVTFILFVLEVLFIERFLKTKKKRYPIYLILIAWLIANLHCAVFAFFFILFLPYLGEYLLLCFIDWDLDKKIILYFEKKLADIIKKEEFVKKMNSKIENTTFELSERRRKRKIMRENPYKLNVEKNKTVLILLAVMIIAGLTGFLNPAGNGAYTYLYKTLQGNTTKSINEHLPVVLAENKEFWITIVMFITILVFSDTKIKLHDLFMLCGLTFLSIESRRQVSMFALFCGPILATLIANMFEKYDKKTYKKLLYFFTDWFGGLLIICVFVLVSIYQIKPKFSEEYVDKNSYPVDAAEWMLENLDIKNMKLYNEYNYGSYLLFKGIPVFIDSRCDLYSPEFNENKKENIEGRDIFSDALNIAGISVDYNSKFEEYGVTHVITYANSKLAMLMNEDDKYKLLYNNGNFKIYERLAEVKETSHTGGNIEE